jgi:cyclopropane fatty-acyl-phospholipid synthase-like methyltransferase
MLAPRQKLWSTPEPAIDIALDYANLTVNDIVYDVGCGDGRVLIRMASMSINNTMMIVVLSFIMKMETVLLLIIIIQ